MKHHWKLNENGDARYLAGITDGEGYLALRKHKRPDMKSGYAWWPIFIISLCNESLVRELHKEWGVGRVNKNLKIPELGRKQIYRWIMESESIRLILPIIYPYLRLKKELAGYMIEALPLIEKGRFRTEEENSRLEKLHQLCVEFHFKNGKGPTPENV